MERNHVGAAQGGGKIVHLGGAVLSHDVGVDVGVVDQDLHAKRGGAFRYLVADAFQADDEQGLLQNGAGGEAGAHRPASLAHGRVMGHALLGQGQHHEKRLLGDRRCVDAADHRNRHAKRAQGIDGDVFVADAVYQNDPQACTGLRRLGREAGAHEDGVSLGDVGQNVGLVKRLQHLDR